MTCVITVALIAVPLGVGFDVHSALIGDLVYAPVILIVYIGVPVLWIRYVFKGSARSYGWCLPQSWRSAARDSAIVLAVLLPLGVLVSTQPDAQVLYSAQGQVRDQFLWCDVVLPIVFFVGFDFEFRGFLFMRLLTTMSRRRAYLIAAVLYTFLHLGKPATEIPLAFVASFGLGWLMERHRSVVLSAAVHYLVAVEILVLTTYIWLPLHPDPNPTLF